MGDESARELSAKSEDQEIALGKPGNIRKLKLTALGNRPYACPEIVPSWWKLRSTHNSVTGLFDTLHLVRTTRAKQKNAETRGRLGRDEQDLLRAAIVFTSAGVDAAVKSLIAGCVPVLITKPGTAKLKYETFVENQVRSPEVEGDFVAALKSVDPAAQILQLYVRSKTKASFQGSSDLRERAGGALGITAQQIPKKRFADLDEFFTARNDVAHQLDMDDPARLDAAPPRKTRSQRDVELMCDQVLLLVRDIIRATAQNVGNCH
ncbi:hypothetical protein [Streptomyces ochraceiscleroticus]|uniref:RiboL-PSP-HEPN domain-containing protein n=1 Tax=Streptomyces ochraceiscleroticus TaxID=47761 RepID=A0ABW1MLJ3_9ACTN|nr:hypothetical protein [Streptomyces ochraceiscleroticus]